MSLETFLKLVALIVVYTMAVYRVAFMASLERGPFDLAVKFRYAVLRRFPPPANAAEYLPPDWAREHWIVSGVKCANCISFWLAPFASVLIVLHFIAPGSVLYAADVIALSLAISGIVVVL